MIYVNKYAYHVDWDAVGRGVNFPSSGGAVGFDIVAYLANYYTKVELQTSGSAQVHFDNITEAYHNNLLDLQGGLTTSSGDSSGRDAEYYHLDESTYLDVVGIDFQMSLTKDSANVVTLFNDEDSPGSNQVYSTDESGVKGWHDLPSGTISGTGADNQIAVFNDVSVIEGTSGLTYDGSNLAVTGTITATGDMVATDFDLSSDERLKTNIKPIIVKSLDLEYKQFELKAKQGQIRYGVIAQDIIKTHPELVRIDKDGMMSVSYIDLLIREIVNLKEKVKKLESIIEYK